MIILKDIEFYNTQLQNILTLTASKIQEKSIVDPGLLNLSGSLFERVVCETLNDVSLKFDFESKFEQSSAHSFPDIYIKILENKWFGIEVKTSQGDWKCFGNSIFESVKVPNLEDRIYVFFGKFSSKSLDCRWAKYDSCIDNINITHSPRYQINMDIVGNPTYSVFAKMDTTYLDFSNSDTTKRMEYVRKFKRQGLGQDVALWWLPDSEEPSEENEKKLIMKLLSELSTGERQLIRNQAMAYFPEIFSNSTKSKYSQVLTWLASQHGVVTGNLRDLFTSGGKWEVSILGNNYRLPKVCQYIFIGSAQIKEFINNSPQEDLNHRWKLDQIVFTTELEKLNYWIEIVSSNLSQLNTMPKKFPIRAWLYSVFNN